MYLHPLNGDEIPIGEAIKRGLIHIQAVTSQITDQRSEQSSKISVHIESRSPGSTVRPSTSASASHGLKRETEIIEIEAAPRSAGRRHHSRTEEVIEEYTTNTVDEQIIIKRGRSGERPRQKSVEKVLIDDRGQQRRDQIDFREEREYIRNEFIREPPPPPPPTRPRPTEFVHRDHEVRDSRISLSLSLIESID